MATEVVGSRLPLSVRIFLACALLVALAVAGSVSMTRWVGERIAAEAVQQALRQAAEAQARLSEQRLRLLERSTELVASDPALAAYLAAASGDALGLGDDGTPDLNSLRDLLAERRAQFGFDLGLLLDSDAALLARSDQGEALAQAFERDPLVATATQRLASRSGYWRFENALYQAAITPLTQDGALVGFLMLAQRVDDALSRDIARSSDAQVAYWLLDGARPLGLLASSLNPADAQALRAALALAQQQGRLRSNQAPERLDLAFAGQTWLMQMRPVAGQDSNALGAISVLASGEHVLSGYRQIFRWSLLAGLICLAAALPLSFWLSRQMLAPARRLAAVAEAAAGGEYGMHLAIAGSDELARLGQALAKLLSRLREKQDMERYLADVSQHLPDRVAMVNTRSAPSATEANVETALAAFAAQLAMGARLDGRYEILALLGSGGMGMVYKARDNELGEVVALKVLRSATLQDEEQLERLKDEIRLARRITHPNVLRTFDFGEADGHAFVTMEYVRGLTLRALLSQSGRLPYSAGLRIARQLVAGLEAAHGAGVLHRDIKPENLILEANGNAKLMDFGIARPKHRDGVGLTQAGMVLGSPAYSAPEQLSGGEVDERSDLYACGVLLSEVMCGQRPFQATSAVEMFMAQMQGRLIRPSVFWPEVPQALEDVILRCLAPRPGERFQSAADLAAALGELNA